MRLTIGARQLQTLAGQLAERDWAILIDLATFRLLTGSQLRRLHFTGHASLPAAARAANGVLHRLAHTGLIHPLPRRIGGIRGGSDGSIWHLTGAGQRLIALRQADHRITQPIIGADPSPRMVDHTLAVAETAVRLRLQAAVGQLELLSLQTEPDCWRDYLDGSGTRRVLKPDLFTITAATGADDEQLWFIEIRSE